MQIFLQSRGTDWSALFCASKSACSCIYRDGRCLTDSGMTQPAPDFLYQGMHLPVPGTVFFVVHAVFQITQYMCKAFLVAGSILIKGYIMIVDQCSPDSLQRPCPLFHRVPFCPWQNRAHRHPEPHIQIHTNFPRLHGHWYSLYA